MAFSHAARSASVATPLASKYAPATLTAIDQASTLGQLVAAALAWADTEPVKDMAPITEKYRLATTLKALQDSIDPQAPAVTIEKPADVCSHGVAFTADCADCGA